MTTTKLVTTHKSRTTPSPSAQKKRKRQNTSHAPHDGDQVTYRETFNILNSTLAQHGLLITTMKTSCPTIVHINRPNITLLNNVLTTIVDKHTIIGAVLLALEQQHKEAHDTRLVQTDEYRKHHKTPDTDFYAPTATQTTERHLVATCTATTALAATINTPHTVVSMSTKYDSWSTALPPSPLFIASDTPTDICRKHANLTIVNRSAIKVLRRIKRQLSTTIGRQRTDTINHNINISQIRRACQAARPRVMAAPQLCIAATHPRNPGQNPVTIQAMTIPDQIQATRDTYGRQMAPPPGKALFYGTLSHDAAGPAGVTMHPQRHFTEAHLAEYHPLHTMFDSHTKHRVIQAHRNLKYLFQPVPQHPALYWPWRLKNATTTMEPVPELLPQISRVPGSARHGGFTLNVLARFPPPWTHLAQCLIHHSLVHRILPQVTKDHTKVPIPKPGDPFTSRPITLNHDWEAFLTGWISDKMTDGLELANTLPSYIYAYRKGKSIDDLTLNHMMFLEDTQQFPHAISAALSDDIEKFFDRITVETQIVAMYQHGCPRHGYAEWIAETSYHSTALFATKHAHILLDVLCGAKQGSSLACPSSNVVASFKSKAFFPPPQLPHKPLVEGYAFQFNSRDARSTAQHLVLTIQSYCDDDTRYTAAIHISHLILQVQWSLDRAGDFFLITKLGRKHKKSQLQY